MRNPPLSPKVIEYCQRCSKREGVAIVAYCCYLSFTDGTIEAAETVTVNASEEQFGISPAMTDLYRKWDSAYANRNVQ